MGRSGKKSPGTPPARQVFHRFFLFCGRMGRRGGLFFLYVIILKGGRGIPGGFPQKTGTMLIFLAPAASFYAAHCGLTVSPRGGTVSFSPAKSPGTATRGPGVRPTGACSFSRAASRVLFRQHFPRGVRAGLACRENSPPDCFPGWNLWDGLFGGRIFAFRPTPGAGKTASSAAPVLPRRKDVKSSRPGAPSRRVGPPQRARSLRDRLALSPPALFASAGVSASAEAELGLRPNAPPPFAKGGRKLFLRFAGVLQSPQK